MHKLQKHDDTKLKANATTENIFWTSRRSQANCVIEIGLEKYDYTNNKKQQQMLLKYFRILVDDSGYWFFLERRLPCASSPLSQSLSDILGRSGFILCSEMKINYSQMEECNFKVLPAHLHLTQ